MDEKTQFPTGGKTLNAWLPAPDVTIVDAQDGEANVGVKMRRTLALTDRYLLDLFTVSSDDVHRYDWAYRNSGALKTSPKPAAKPGTLGVTDGYQYMSVAKCHDVGVCSVPKLRDQCALLECGGGEAITRLLRTRWAHFATDTI